MSTAEPQPRWTAIRLTENDNVATALTDLAAGAVPRLDGLDNVPALTAAIPAGHKFALQPIAAGAHVVKYGQPIGEAITAIEPGAHVHLHNLAGFAGRAHRGGETSS